MYQKLALIISNRDLMSEWDWEKNQKEGLDPNILTLGSERKAFWKCSKNHSYQAPIARRVYNHSNCPYCSNQRILIGFNDLSTLRPDLAKEWSSKNDKTPCDVGVGSGYKAWWTCEKGHEYQSIIKDRAGKRNRGCPYCAGQKPIFGFNDLQTTNPTLAQEWHPTKNGNLKPSDVMQMTNKKVWWICQYNHEWQASIAKRSIGEGCPICQTFNRTSMPEYIIYFYVKKYFGDTINGYKASYLGTNEIDIFIPSKKVGIEYDGVWHIIERDVKKDKICKENGIKLIRVRNSKTDQYEREDSTYVINQDSKEELSETIKEILIFLGINIKQDEINVGKDFSLIYEQYHSIKVSNNLKEKYPSLAKEWHPTKNGNLKPENIPATTSSKKYWWKCSKCGYEWEAQLNNRINRINGKNCPVCSGRRVLLGYNDLQTTNPTLAQEWHPTKNGNLKPSDVTKGCNKRVWWKCSKCGHEWEASVNERTRGRKCPICHNKIII